MGIFKLSELLVQKTPSAIRLLEFESTKYVKVAIDAPVLQYQFLNAPLYGSLGKVWSNRHGEDLRSLHGLLFRTLGMVENGMKPVMVFERRSSSKAEKSTYEDSGESFSEANKSRLSEMKSQTLVDRREARNKMFERWGASADQAKARKAAFVKLGITHENNEECQTLLTLMGIPWMEAPGEAEAQCAALVKSGDCWATGTEDMDALTFGSKVLLRNLKFGVKKASITAYYLDEILKEMELTYEQFVDLCILLGCDYTGTILNVGPVKAVKLIKEHGSIERILENGIEGTLTSSGGQEVVGGLDGGSDLVEPETNDQEKPNREPFGGIVGVGDLVMPAQNFCVNDLSYKRIKKGIDRLEKIDYNSIHLRPARAASGKKKKKVTAEKESKKAVVEKDSKKVIVTKKSKKKEIVVEKNWEKLVMTDSENVVKKDSSDTASKTRSKVAAAAASASAC